MDVINLLKSIQVEFIQRLNTNQDEELLCSRYEGNYSELKIITLDELTEARAFAWCMVNKFRHQSNDARTTFCNHFKGKVGELTVKHCLGDYITPLNYEILPTGDGKVDFRSSSNRNVGMQVKTRYGNTKSQWRFSSSEIDSNEILACVLVHDKNWAHQSFDEFRSEYRLVMAGFIPSALIKRRISESISNFEKNEADSFVTVTIEDLLHGSGLKNYLKNLEFMQNLQWRECEIKTKGGDICSLIISRTNKTVVTGDSCHCIKFWDLEHQTLQHSIKSTRTEAGDGHSGDVTALALSPDNQFFASASDDETIRVWASKTKKLLKILTGHSSSIYSLAYTPQGEKLVSGSADETIKVWNLTKHELEFTLDAENCVNSVSVHPKGNILGAAGKDRNIRFWKIEEQQMVGKFLAHNEEISNICFSNNSLLLASCSYDKTIRMWNISYENLLNGVRPNLRYEIPHKACIDAVTISSDNQLLAGIDTDGTVYLYQVDTGQLICEYPNQLRNRWSRSHAIAFSLDGKLLVAGAKHIVKVWQRLN
ncbi:MULTISPECIES: WD40 repeat domain-containing protein [Cyanophyceae]|uniref:WD40 repeat domain-containing protein n=1 Tax=Cyanophyceae TaxID=3028117 RepID=UPI001689EE72|nr:WD40 repeat domain-containing protein [Trichocoleus sp. FACHB-69]MBD1931897.1 WD40 repeat domain-containing protein [Trichocoleus sp. FACHB-69]